MQLRYLIGIDIMLWGSDFPHASNTYPHSRDSLNEMFADVPDEERRRVLVLNPCELFGARPGKRTDTHPQSPLKSRPLSLLFLRQFKSCKLENQAGHKKNSPQ